MVTPFAPWTPPPAAAGGADAAAGGGDGSHNGSNFNAGADAAAAVSVDSGEGAPPVQKKAKKAKKPSSYKALLRQMTAPRKTEEQKKADAVAKIKSSLGGGTFQKLQRL